MTVYTSGSAKTYYYLTDRLGSVHALADEFGNILESYRFDAWGKILGIYDANGNHLSESAYGNRFLWQGREYSWKAGLYYFRARWYDPITGRWLSNDPIGISGGLNQYVFCANNPINFVDPFGLCKKTQRQIQTQFFDAQAMMMAHYNISRGTFGLWGKFLVGVQDIKIFYRNDIFIYQGQLISPGYMGNMAVGYTAYRHYGFVGAVMISVLGEFYRPDWRNIWSGARGSFEANAYGIAEAMIAEYNQQRIRLTNPSCP